jgi:hypothetical protein
VIEPNPTASARPGNRLWPSAAGLFLVVFLLFASRLLLGNKPIFGGGGDTVGTRWLPVSLLTEGNVDLDEFSSLRPDGTCPYFLVAANGHYYSAHPIGGAFLLVPIYALAQVAGLDVLRDTEARDLLAGYTAALLAALSVVIVFLTYARRGIWRALAVALVYGLGTGVWPICAQDVWQHTFGIVFMAWALYLLDRGVESPACLGWVGLPAGLLFAVRPANGLIVALLGLHVLLSQPRQLLRFALLGVPFLAATLIYNVGVLGHLFGAYSDEAANISPWHNILRGLPGLLVSPARGLLVYSPFVLLGFLAVWRKDSLRRLRLTLAAILLVQLLVYGSFVCWYGGYGFGPRFLLEAMPACAGLLWYAWPACTAGMSQRLLTVLLVGWSVLANASGYVFDWSVWCTHPDLDRCQGRLWDWRDNPLAAAALGLPPHGRNPLRPSGTDLVSTQGVGMELGHGWTIDGGLLCMGGESELLFRFRGAPVSRLVLQLQSEEGLPQVQQVTVELNGQVRGEATLSSAKSTELVVPVAAEDRGRGEARLTLRFTAWRCRSWNDIRPIAAHLTGLQAHFDRK